MPKTLFDLSVQCANNHILANLPTILTFGRLDGKRKNEATAILCGTGLSRDSSTDRKLHATREKTLHAQKFRTAEVTICIIPERTARSLPTVSVRLETQVVEDTVSLPKVSNVLLMVVHQYIRP